MIPIFAAIVASGAGAVATAIFSLRRADGTPEENRVEAIGSAAIVLGGAFTTGVLAAVAYAMTCRIV